MMILDGDRLIVPESADQPKQKGRADRDLRLPFEWPAQEFKQIGVHEATLVTAWNDGKLQYQISLKPVPKNFDKGPLFVAPLTLIFIDVYGFQSVKVDLYNLAGVTDEKGSRIGLSEDSSIPCSQAKYEELMLWTLSWRL